VIRIHCRFRRQRNSRHQCFRQHLNAVNDLNERQTFQVNQTLLYGPWITGAAFVRDEAGYHRLMFVPVVIPPVMRHLLAGRDPQIAAGAHSQVADDCGFEIDGGFHGSGTATRRACEARQSDLSTFRAASAFRYRKSHFCQPSKSQHSQELPKPEPRHR
jgi:hypothetical protein